MNTPDDPSEDQDPIRGVPGQDDLGQPQRSPAEKRPTTSQLRFLTIAGLILIAGLVTALVLSLGGGDDTTVDLTPTPTEAVQPTSAPEETPTPEETPARPDGFEPIDLSDAVDLGTSADDSLRLFAVPTTAELGCEGGPSWRLFWVADDDTGKQAADATFFDVPDYVKGPGGRVAFLASCEEQTSALLAGVEDPAGVLGPLTAVEPEGWEGVSIQSVIWTSDGALRAAVTRLDDLQATFWDITIDPVTGEIVSFDPQNEGECSASELTEVTWAPLDQDHPWGSKARAIQAAALSCDYDALADLAADEFTYSFGGGDDFAGFLRDSEEQFGDDPMRQLVLMLEAEPAVREGDPTDVVWPAFFACELTCGMDVDELHRLGYTDEDIAGFEAFGGYIGYRLSFVQVPNADGSPLFEWRVFVAGD